MSLIITKHAIYMYIRDRALQIKMAKTITILLVILNDTWLVINDVIMLYTLQSFKVLCIYLLKIR